MLDFEIEWNQISRITCGVHDIDIYDVKPSHAKAAPPVILAPGWGGTPEMYKRNMLTLVHRGRRALAAKAPRGIDFAEQFPFKSGLSAQAKNRAGLLIFTLNAKGIERADAIGHSQGCIDLVYAARSFPERFNSIVLVDPAGLIANDSSWQLCIRFLADAIGSCLDSVRTRSIRQPLVSAFREIASSFIRDPLGALSGIHSMVDSHLQDALLELRDSNVGLSIIHGVSDGVFPINRVQQAIDRRMFHGFLSVRGRHGQFQLEPTLFTALAEQLLGTMEGKSPTLPNSPG
jgi:pimeloyl-ACP methyl ester carboxylesterase